MWNHFFKHIDIDSKNLHLLDGNAADVIPECNEYERAIQEAGGIGPDGHIAFNEPGRKCLMHMLSQGGKCETSSTSKDLKCE